MSIIHLVVGDLAAEPLKAAIQQDSSTNEEVVVLKDILHVGPLRSEDKTFSEGRSAFWAEVTGVAEITHPFEDMEQLMQLSSRLSNKEEDKIWFWMAPAPADTAAYFWLLHFLKKHQGRFYVVNINGLPFLDENGKLFYPESIARIPPKEIIKAKKLARATLPSEWETDADEWPRLSEENTGIRILEGGKKLTSKDISHYDDVLLSLAGSQNQKISRLINTACTKHKIPTGDTFLEWRLKVMAANGLVELSKNEIRIIDKEADKSNA